MANNDVLKGLLQAYVGGDLVARRALLGYPGEGGGPPRGGVGAEAIDWNAVALGVAVAAKRSRDVKLFRFYVDCARFNAGAQPEVVQAVREARRRWLQGLFPEIDLSGGP